jgi:APA family basic amino acid/polyamine antiporter
MMMFGQTRILFTMSRDGLMPQLFSRVHPKYQTPHVVTLITGVAVAFFAAMFPVGALADISNSGTLFAFFVVALGVMVLRVRQPGRARSFRTPFIWVVGPLAMAGCLLLFLSLDSLTLELFFGWAVAGLFFYYLYARRRSQVGQAEASAP